MPTILPSELITQLNWRYATKTFDASKKLTASQFQTLKDALRLSASSFGLQPWKFIVVENPEIRSKLRPASWGQSQIEEASHLVVLAGKTSIDAEYIKAFIKKTADVRGVSPDTLDGYYQMMIGNIVNGSRTQAEIKGWMDRQVYIAMGTLLTAAALIGVDTCPIEGLDPNQYDAILNLTDTGYQTLAVVALGFRAESDPYQNAPKVRFDESDVFQVI